MTHNSCRLSAQVLEYHLGLLSDHKAKRFEKHLSSCPSCKTACHNLRNNADSLVKANPEVVPLAAERSDAILQSILASPKPRAPHLRAMRLVYVGLSILAIAVGLRFALPMFEEKPATTNHTAYLLPPKKMVQVSPPLPKKQKDSPIATLEVPQSPPELSVPAIETVTPTTSTMIARTERGEYQHRIIITKTDSPVAELNMEESEPDLLLNPTAPGYLSVSSEELDDEGNFHWSTTTTVIDSGHAYIWNTTGYRSQQGNAIALAKHYDVLDMNTATDHNQPPSGEEE